MIGWRVTQAAAVLVLLLAGWVWYRRKAVRQAIRDHALQSVGFPRRVLVRAPQNVRMVQLSAVITRADGTIEDYGVESYAHRSWWRSWVGQARIKFFSAIGYRRVRVTRPGQSPRHEWRRIERRA